MNIAIRVDASYFMGIGHVMRCLTLANALSDAGHNIHFVCRAHQGHMGEKILSEGHGLYLLPTPLASIEVKPDPLLSPPHQRWLGTNWLADVLETQDVISGLDVDWLIVDHYSLDANWETQMRSVVKHILVIDDLADRFHNCDALLDQTINQPAVIYEDLVPNHCELLIGSDYALLRPEFSLLRPESLARRKEPKLNQLAIVLGGGDQSHNILKVLTAIKKSTLAKTVKIVLVISEYSLHYEQVCSLSEQMPNEIIILPYVDDMAQLMLDTDLVIGAAGVASLERCCLGVPTLLYVLAENQRTNALALSAMKAVYVIGDLTTDLVLALNAIVKAPRSLSDFTKAASDVVDGQGVQRVMKRLQFV